MDIQTGDKSSPENIANGFVEKARFMLAVKFILFSCFLGVMAQNFYIRTAPDEGIHFLGLGVALILFGIFGMIWGNRIYRIIDTPFFAISSILLIALATAMGTFIGQNMTTEAFLYRYGQIGGNVLTFLNLNDVFHSWWYVILFLLLTISLVKLSFRRKFSIPNLGFHLAHLGPVIVLFGFWWDYYAGYRGLIQLETGKTSSLVNVYHRNTNRVKDTVNLDFNLKLDYFKSEKFEPDHRIQLWENSPGPNQQVNSRIIASLPVELEKERKIYNTDIEFAVKEYYPNFYLQYSYPDDADTVAAVNPGILFELINPHGSNIIHLRTNRQGQNRMADPILGVSFEFYWILPDQIRTLIDDFDPSSGWAQNPKVIFLGQENKVYEVGQGNIVERDIVYEEEYQVPGKSKSGYKLIFIYPDAAYLISEPATKDLKQENPVARLEITRPDWSEPKEAFVYPQDQGPGGQFVIPETNYLLALESIRDQETKFWESGLSVVGEDGTVRKQKQIVVNEPLLYNGYRFYQSDYDPNNPNYSGIGVSYTPGLTLIYFGFYVLIAGVIMLFYIRHKENEQLIELQSDPIQ